MLWLSPDSSNGHRYWTAQWTREPRGDKCCIPAILGTWTWYLSLGTSLNWDISQQHDENVEEKKGREQLFRTPVILGTMLEVFYIDTLTYQVSNKYTFEKHTSFGLETRRKWNRKGKITSKGKWKQLRSSKSLQVLARQKGTPHSVSSWNIWLSNSYP